ncbi:methanol dehydrogenase [Candidatus Peregrinibacteria bacterium CG10_big_fil_rev_8_21_14_0_10_49_16]|nr:MAG: methanol dehydrogenase [Candidatus Peregrinibacteria bacterium CG22_combo_CG10-13_8_21_14_all_49_11]PIR51804.1 MAG: methanol dehydrogenase [Candidatus Peregrinibacteria bacterium CG10_big_fil_rev_8_21_14_0_10_49_16]
MVRHACVCVIVILVSAPTVFGADVPTLQSPVNDYGNILSISEEQELKSALLSQEKQTSNQIVILTIPSLDGDNLEMYANMVFNTWKLGTAKNDNGVLILYAVKEDKIRIEVGQGLEGSIPDAIASQIIRKEMRPKFTEQDYAGGFSAAIIAITKAAKGEYEVDGSGGGGISIIWLFVAIGLIVVIFTIVYAVAGMDGVVMLLYILTAVARRGGGGGGGYGGSGGRGSGGGASG